MAEGSSRGNEGKLVTLLVITIVLIFAGLIWASLTNESFMGGLMGGMMGHDNSTGFPLGTTISLVGVLLFFVILVLIVLGRGREVSQVQPQAAAYYQPAEPQESTTSVTEDDMQRLTLRLLNGDERKLFRRIHEAGGEVLQKDLVAEGTFSKAKVTRLLDKLENKGLVVRERYGSTNRVRIPKDLGK
ncbi:MAG: MarR family transcriptional regulator [Thermoplasmata archaeon]